MEIEAQGKTGFFQLFMSMWFRPRATIRSIVDTNPDRGVILLACISGIYQTLDRSAKQGSGDTMGVPAIVLLALIMGPISGLLALTIGKFLFQWAGKIIGGKGSSDEVRAALAWSSVPDSILLLLFIPIIAFLGRDAFTSGDVGGEFTDIQTGVLLFYSIIIGLPLVIWKAYISVQTMAEVHQFAWWKGILTYIISFAVVGIPIIALLWLFGAFG